MKSPPPPANLETHFEFFISELDTAFEESPPPTPSGEGVSREALPLVDLQYLNPPPPIPGVAKLTSSGTCPVGGWVAGWLG